MLMAILWFLMSGVLIVSAAGWWLTARVSLGSVRELSAGSPGLFSFGILIMQWGAPALLVGLSLLFGLFGVLSLVGSLRRSALEGDLARRGIPAQGVITYLDRNYSLLVNNRPIYSIVEYRYCDAGGAWYTNRVPNLNSDLAIRSGWQVGAAIPVRYLPENPARSAIAFAV
ncbi:MAG: DUF3592 domain-containing protein [Dehalococcoidia bacterium]